MFSLAIFTIFTIFTITSEQTFDKSHLFSSKITFPVSVGIVNDLCLKSTITIIIVKLPRWWGKVLEVAEAHFQQLQQLWQKQLGRGLSPVGSSTMFPNCPNGDLSEETSAWVLSQRWAWCWCVCAASTTLLLSGSHEKHYAHTASKPNYFWRNFVKHLVWRTSWVT